MTPETLAVCCGSSLANADIYAAHLSNGMDRYQIDTPARQAAFLATVAIESDRLRRVEENLWYTTPERLAMIFPSLFGRKGRFRAEDYVRNPAGLSRLRYQGFHGRGLIQLTWSSTYAAAGRALGFDYVGSPALVEEPLHAALTACWYFAEYKPSCLHLADRGDMPGITELVNGPLRLQLAERVAQMDVALNVLGGKP